MANQTQRKILNISLPPRLYRRVKKAAEREEKTKSEFARDALRWYFERRKRRSFKNF